MPTKHLVNAAAVLLCLLGCSPVCAQVAAGNCSTVAVAAGATSVTSNTFTVSGSNVGIIAYIGFFGSPIPTSITFTYDPGGANQAMTTLGTASGVSNGEIALGGLVAPGSTGSRTVQASWTNASGAALAVCSFTGVDQTGGATSFPNFTSNTAGASVTVTGTGSNDGAAGEFFATGSVTSTNGTQVYTENSVTGTAANYVTGSANPTLTLTGSGPFMAIGVTIKAAGGATGCTRHNIMTLGAGC